MKARARLVRAVAAWAVRAALIAVCALPMPLSAHGIIASAYATGQVIEGEIGLSNGAMAKGVTVTVAAPDGADLGQVVTDEEGFFTFRPSRAVDHIFRADMGAGHVAIFLMQKSDLPRHLREGGGGGGGGDADAAGSAGVAWSGALGGSVGGSAVGSAAAGGAANGASLMPAAGAGMDGEALAALLQDELRPLKREVAALGQERRMQDILGGLGYIAGLFGVAFYIAARRKLGQGA